jgi:hypothetical protein
VRILRDFWVKNPDDPDKPIRHRKGNVIEVGVEQALDGVEAGALARVK